MKDTKRLMGKQALGEKWAECGFALKGGGGVGGGVLSVLAFMLIKMLLLLSI